MAMPRAARLYAAGVPYHVISRGVGGMELFQVEEEYLEFLHLLNSIKKEQPFRLYSYCLMPNHIHLLMEMEVGHLHTVMRRLLGAYALRFNIRRNRFGHVFQNRYKAIRCGRDSHFLELLRYIHLNPVRARLVSDPADWAWSSHRDYSVGALGTHPDVAHGLAFFSSNVDDARRAYREFIVGSPEINDLESLGQQIAAETGVPLDVIQGSSREKTCVLARALFIQRALKRCARAAEIARFLGRSQSAISQARLKKAPVP